jgi:hypothetical protein
MSTTNQIKIALGNLYTGLTALVPGSLKGVSRAVYDPISSISRPHVGMLVASWQRTQGSVYHVVVELSLAVDIGAGALDDATLDAATAIDDKIAALLAGGSLGCYADRPLWTPWYVVNAKSGAGAVPVGAKGNITLHVTRPVTRGT